MDLGSCPVAAVMREDFAVLSPDDPVDDIDPIAGDLMTTRHFVVVDAVQRVVGIVSVRDLLEVWLVRSRACGDAAPPSRSMLVSDLMARPVETVGPRELLAAAANRMISHRIGCLPVVRADGVVIGLVSDADLLAAAYRPPRVSGSESSSGSASSSR